MDIQSDSYSFILQRCGPAPHGRIIPLNPMEVGIFIGRSEECFMLNSLFVSRQHVQVCFKQGKWFLVDLNSFNNTYLLQNGEVTKINPFEDVEIVPGAVIGLGVNPKVWASKDEYINDQDFFVYEFKIQDNVDVGHLCESFHYQINV